MRGRDRERKEERGKNLTFSQGPPSSKVLTTQEKFIGIPEEGNSSMWKRILGLTFSTLVLVWRQRKITKRLDVK